MERVFIVLMGITRSRLHQWNQRGRKNPSRINYEITYGYGSRRMVGLWLVVPPHYEDRAELIRPAVEWYLVHCNASYYGLKC